MHEVSANPGDSVITQAEGADPVPDEDGVTDAEMDGLEAYLQQR